MFLFFCNFVCTILELLFMATFNPNSKCNGIKITGVHTEDKQILFDLAKEGGYSSISDYIKSLYRPLVREAKRIKKP